MADELLGAALAEKRDALRVAAQDTTGATLTDMLYRAGLAAGVAHAALAAVDAVLAGHPLTATVRHTMACTVHAYTAIGARRDCAACVTVEYHDGCEECRDEFGTPVRPADCRARKAILGALTGGNTDG